jgi:sugar lactone lactonase YvrE
MRQARVRKLDVPISVLGEGPVWSDRDHCLYFVDIASRRLQAYRPHDGSYEAWQFDEYVGSLGECRDGGLVVALTDRLVRFNPSRGTGSIETIAVLERDRPLNRLNDGKVDPWGRFWVGSMQADETVNRGRLWCVSPTGGVTQHRDDIGVSNSLAFDAQRSRMYFADSKTGVIEQCTLDGEHVPGIWKPFAPAQKGSPDGSCVDAEGFLWNAEWAGARIVRYSPEGRVDRVVETPVSRPSCCAFGGADYKTLFVTSAHYKMGASDRAADPDAGSLYAIELDDVQGRPADRFAA